MSRGRSSDSNGPATAKGARLVSLDATRGFCLLLLISGGLGLQRLGNGFFFDLLPAAFFLCAGIAQTYSRAQRQGQSWPRQAAHALWRLGLLLLLGLYLDSYRAGQLVLEPRGDLQTIALATFAAFLVLPLGGRGQALVALFLLVAHAAVYLLHAKVAGHEGWQAGNAFDQWFHLAPLPSQRVLLNLVPTTATVLLGAALGELLRGGMVPGRKLALLLLGGGGALLVGTLLAGSSGWLCPWPALMPALAAQWTITYVGLAVGCAVLLFALFYALADALQWRPCCLPLALVGRHALPLYLAFVLFHDWALRSVNLVLPDSRPWLAAYKPLLSQLLLLSLFWLLGFWLSRRQNVAKA